MSIAGLTASELISGYESGQFSAVEATQEYLSLIDQKDQQLHTMVSVDHEGALERARSIDTRRSTGESLGRMAGVPIAVKDLICIKGHPTRCGSRMLESYVPPYNATVVERLQNEDAILIGKTNLDEFAMGSSTEHAASGVTRNPWDPTRIPGGSSGGSAACVAARLSPISLGTDTGGSIRQPASLCGVVGLKPTYGRVSRFGLVAFASSLDQIGPFATTAADVRLALDSIAGPDPKDSTCSPHSYEPSTKHAREDLRGLRIGKIREHFDEGLDSEVAASVEEASRVLTKLGATVEEVSLPTSGYGVATYYVIAPCEASSNLARYDAAHYGYRTPDSQTLDEMYSKSRSEGFGREVKRRIMLGTYALSEGYYDAYYLKALKVRRLIRNDYEKAFDSFDLLLGPTSPTTAFEIGEKADDPLAMYLADIYTVPANLAGVPAISIPCGFDSDRLPIGLQLQARPFDEATLLGVAEAFQNETDWHQRRPQ